MSPPSRGEGLACLNDFTDYAGGNYMFLAGPPKPDKPHERSQTKRDKLILQEWGFYGGLATLPRKIKYS